MPGVEVLGVADPDVERARTLAARFGVPRAVADHRALLDLGLDALSIVAPDDVHHQVAAAALDAAAWRSSARSRSAARWRKPRDLVARAERARVATKIGFVFRYSPALRQLRALVRDGYVGRVHSLIVYSQNPQFMDPAAPFHWKMDRERTGGGVFVEYGSHSLDLARWIAGEILGGLRQRADDRARAQGRAAARPGVSTWTTSARGWRRRSTAWRACSTRAGRPSASRGATSPSSATGAPSSGGGATTSGPSLSCYGATTAAPTLSPVALPGPGHRGTRVGHDLAGVLHGNLARAFVAEVRGAPAEGPTFADGHRAQLGLWAVATSLAERRWVPVPAN